MKGSVSSLECAGGHDDTNLFIIGVVIFARLRYESLERDVEIDRFKRRCLEAFKVR